MNDIFQLSRTPILYAAIKNAAVKVRATGVRERILIANCTDLHSQNFVSIFFIHVPLLLEASNVDTLQIWLVVQIKSFSLQQ